jgi:hypothetical protein
MITQGDRSVPTVDPADYALAVSVSTMPEPYQPDEAERL